MLNQELKLVFPKLYELAKKETEKQGKVMHEKWRLIGVFDWSESSQGHSFWADIWVSDFKIWKEDATMEYLKRYKPHIYEEVIAEIINQRGYSEELARSLNGVIAAYFVFSATIKGRDYWGSIAYAKEAGKVCKREVMTIAKRLSKTTPFTVEDSKGRLLYREDSKGDWYRRKYDEKGDLILIKNSKGKLWRTTVTTG